MKMTDKAVNLLTQLVILLKKERKILEIRAAVRKRLPSTKVTSH